MKVLIVDDEAHIRQMMRLTLEAAGYEVEEAGTGEDGLTLFRDGRVYDLALVDQKMPGIDGLQTLARMKDRLPEASVVMVTAFASIDLAVEAMRLGATDFLRKPMTPETLRGAVAAALASRPRTPLRREPPRTGRPAPRIETLTLNGFQVEWVSEPSPEGTHVFRVRRFPHGPESVVVVGIDPEAVSRVARLGRRVLPAGGSFWREQAQRCLLAHLWTENQVPASGRLCVHDVSREDLEAAAAWPED